MSHSPFKKGFGRNGRTSDHGFAGTFAPFFRASDNPMAIACFLLFTTPPFPPLPDRSVPFFSLCNALSTDFFEAAPYLAISSPVSANRIHGRHFLTMCNERYQPSNSFTISGFLYHLLETAVCPKHFLCFYSKRFRITRRM
jgi:hypothetical protein